MTIDRNHIPHIYLIAGEESGDRLGGSLMRSLIRITSGNVQFSGVGGKNMIEEGIESLFPMDDLAVMGLTEVLPRIPKLIGRLNYVIKNIHDTMPDILVTIDSPDFSFRVARRLAGSDIPCVHYVAPTVWAWRSGRAEKISKTHDHLLTLLPFEPHYFESHGLACTYVGHPVLKSGADRADKESFRLKREIKKNALLIAIIPGSREGEVIRHLPIFAKAAVLLHEQFPDLEIIIPTLEATRSVVKLEVATWQMPVHVTENDHDKYAAFAAAQAALAASGTVTLELAMAGTPAVIGYKMAPVTTFLVKRLVKVRFSNLVNLILDREAIPEYLLDKCRAKLLAKSIADILNNPSLQESQKTAYKEALSLLGHNEFDPNQRASEAILTVLSKKSKRAIETFSAAYLST